MDITYVMFGYDQDWNAFAASSVTAAQAREIAESMSLHGYHMAPSRGEAYPNAKCGSYLANEEGHFERATMWQWLRENYHYAQIYPPDEVP
jgi:hypothetical protein